MHMSDALVSPPVFAATGAVSIALIAIAVRKIGRQGDARSLAPRERQIVPLMGVAGAFVFAAQMINFSIPGTGSSGHIVGGILLAALLGPWAAFLALCSVLILQCLVFADGGFLALGCNILNMAALSCLVAYPFVFRPLMRRDASTGRIFAASIIAAVAALETGAAAVTAETELSGITALPAGRFLLFMMPIHLAIGLCEGVATAAVLCVVRRYRPELLADAAGTEAEKRRSLAGAAAVIALAALLTGGVSHIASSDPDGLEWSIERTAGTAEPADAADGPLHRAAAAVAERTAVMPDYNASAAGVIGSGAIIVAALGVSGLVRTLRRDR